MATKKATPAAKKAAPAKKAAAKKAAKHAADITEQPAAAERAADEPRPAGSALIFPVGHYTGAFYPDVGAPLQYHNVRIGRTPMKLFTEDEFGVWALAHGLHDRLQAGPWTLDAFSTAAAEAGIGDAPTILDEFLEEGIVAAVDRNTEQAVDFALRHRVMPLMLGLGSPPSEIGRYLIGMFGRPAVAVERFGYEVWEWAHLADNLWLACHGFAEVGREVAETDPAELEPEQILDRLLLELQKLLSRNAVVLDAAWEPPEPV